jgi:hypothetical protein
MRARCLAEHQSMALLKAPSSVKTVRQSHALNACHHEAVAAGEGSALCLSIMRVWVPHPFAVFAKGWEPLSPKENSSPYPLTSLKAGSSGEQCTQVRLRLGRATPNYRLGIVQASRSAAHTLPCHSHQCPPCQGAAYHADRSRADYLGHRCIHSDCLRRLPGFPAVAPW